MSDTPIVQVENLSKCYRIWESPSARVISPVLDRIASVFPKRSVPYRTIAAKAEKGYRDFFALDDISFTVRRGQGTGIIGRNGSGKSTLLQMIAGTLTPSSGKLSVTGRVSALLELGSGFNPEFTGRENVFLQGAIYGLGHSEMQKRFDEIAGFADIGDFIEQPVKTYSSGMMVRLAFAVGLAVEPDILIVDEALSVGDVFFQQKCFKKLHQLLNGGVTLLFVSHDMEAVRNLCEQVILLDHGKKYFHGSPDEAVSRYYSLFGKRLEASGSAQQDSAANRQAARTAKETLAALQQHDLLPRAKSRHGAQDLELVHVAPENEHGAPSLRVEMTRKLVLRCLLRAHEQIAAPAIGINIYDRMTNLVFAAGTRQLGVTLGSFTSGEERLVTFEIGCDLQPGPYTFSIEASEPADAGPNFGFLHDKYEGLGPIVIHYEHDHTWPFYGIARLPLKISID